MVCGNRVKKVCSTYVEPKHQSDEHNQAGANAFQHLLWIFWVCQLSLVWYNVNCSQSLSSFDHYQLQLVYLTTEHCPVRNFQHETLQTTFTGSVTVPSQYTAKTFYCISVAFLMFLKIIKHNKPKMFVFFHL